MNKINDIIGKYNHNTLRMDGYNTDLEYRISAFISEAEKDKLQALREKTGLKVSELLRYSIHCFASYL